MSVKLFIQNPELTYEEKTYLTADYLTGTSLTIRNNEGFTSNWFVIVGEPGQEQTECKQISSSTGNETLTLSGALKFSHPKSCPVYLSQWDKVSVERSALATSGFAAITDSPFLIEWDDEELTSTIIDSAGSASHYFRWRFYNSITLTYSSYSGVISGGGLDRNQAGYVIEKVRKNSATQGVSDQTMYDYMNDFQDLCYEEIPEAWWLTREGTEVATTADGYKYNISVNWADLLSIKYVLYRYINGSQNNSYPLSYITPLEFYNYKSDYNQSSSDNASKWTFLPPDASSAKGYIGIHSTPDNDVCYIKPVYYIDLPIVSSFEDVLVIPRPKAYEDYILYRIWEDIKQDSQTASTYNARVQSSIIALKRRSRRQQGQKELFRYRGQKGYQNLFGAGGGSSMTNRENYW
jgi:hypothetical protein